jgi:CheY-like chemotaxis protein
MPQPHHVLIVDDDEQMRLVLARLLKRAWTDASVAEASNGAEALSAVEAQRPDLIITDYHMPVLGGLELVRTLWAQGMTMPILVLSSDPSIAEAIRAAGATAFLPKPFRVRVLRELLRTLLPTDEETQAVGE